MSGIPYLALLIGLVVQTLVTMAAYSVPVAAPAIASALAVPGERVGIFISMVYGVGVLSAVFSPSFIHRYGPVRVSQFILLAGLAMIATVSVLARCWPWLAGRCCSASVTVPPRRPAHRC